MSKKAKVPLTPEEREAILTRRVEKRELFSRTFEKTLAFLLALVFVFSVAHIAFHPNTTIVNVSGGAAQSSVGPAPVSPVAPVASTPGTPDQPQQPSDGSQGLSASSSKEDILNYFNAAINDIKPHAKSVTLKRSANSYPEEGKLRSTPKLPGFVQKLADQLINKNMGESDVSKTAPAATVEAKNGLLPIPGETWASKLTADDVESATVSEANGVYTIVVTAKPDAVSEGSAYGQGHGFKAFTAPTQQIILDNAGAASSLISNVMTGMHDGKCTLTVDKATGHATYVVYHYIWDLHLTAVKTITVDLGFGGDQEYEIAW